MRRRTRELTPPSVVPRDTLDWCERARRDSLALVLDLEATLLPEATATSLASADASVLAALDRAGVRAVIVSGRPLSAVQRLQQVAPAAWWIAEYGAWTFHRTWTSWDGVAIDWVRRQLAGAHVLAIGDHDGLAADERAIACAPSRRPYLRGADAVRAFLWWVVEVRFSGPAWPPPFEIDP